MSTIDVRMLLLLALRRGVPTSPAPGTEQLDVVLVDVETCAKVSRPLACPDFDGDEIFTNCVPSSPSKATHIELLAVA